uniref:RNA polymerase alpha subunit n=1 Tax=Lepocinclis ovum TaxID=86638 RepID=A0A3G3LM30_9EUGL|nr:RNA polymerase alpha subunit [Lepocinclis ovum]AYQ93742.1 RNA polymerase alpha subunit [Lepocinclis ovum]
MRLFKVSISSSYKGFNSFYSILRVEKVCLGRSVFIGNLIRSFLLKDSLRVNNILLFVKNLNPSFSTKYRLVHEFSEFEQLGFPLEKYFSSIKNLNFKVLKSDFNNNVWRGYLEVCGPNYSINSTNISFIPNTLFVEGSYFIGKVVPKYICLKFIFKVVL